MKQRLLIVDDEPGIVDMMASYFSSQYEVLTAYCGNEALQKLARQPDLILLDINMPDIDGLTLCQKIRELITCPILFLTARVESADKIIGFQAGADDYIIKPFDLDELGARVAAHLRREQRHRNKATIRFFGELTIDYSARTVTVAGEPVALSKREFDIVELLSLNAGQVFDRERIYETVWGLDGEGNSDTVMEHEAQLQIYAPNLSAQDKQALKDGTGCLVKNPIAFSYGDTTVQQTDLTVGDTIQLGDRTLPVLGLIDTAITINNDGFTNGVQLIVNDEIYCSLLGNDSYSEVYPTLQDNADTDTFESWLDSWCSNYPGTHWLSYLQSSNEMIESFEQIKMLCWVLIIFIGIIGILNIINTVYSNIHTRVGEIGMQRAIGMSAASLYKTFLWEGAYYGIIASVIGAVFGYVCCIFVGAAQTDALQLVAVPVMAIVEAAIISIVACLLATAIPLRSIARMSIVDSIETVE